MRASPLQWTTTLKIGGCCVLSSFRLVDVHLNMFMCEYRQNERELHSIYYCLIFDETFHQ